MEQPLPDTRPADDGLLDLSFFLSAFIALFKVLSQGAIGGDPALLLSDSCTRNAGTIQKFGFINNFKMQPYMELIKQGEVFFTRRRSSFCTFGSVVSSPVTGFTLYRALT